MFTGIIETIGKVESAETSGTNKIFWVSSPLSAELKTDQSVSHNGVCLTIDALRENAHRVTAIEETLKKSNLGLWKENDEINIERCMVMNGRIDGHIVQGHVDAVAVCMEKKTLEGSWEYRFQFDESFAHLVIEKGSVAVNGTSLTAFDITQNSFSVAIIPYTYNHTSIKQVEAGMPVNIEFDMIGKYLARFKEVIQ